VSEALGKATPSPPCFSFLQWTLFKESYTWQFRKGVLSSISPRSRGIKASLYADDAAIFVKPQKQDITALKEILEMFGQANRIRKNLQKLEVFPINCHDLDLEDILEGFPASVKSFPCRYLGLPLHLRRLRKIDYMPLLDKVGGKLPGWKGKLMSKSARAQLVTSVLTPLVSYHATVFPLPT
jgi:hypothetical protein